MTRFRMDIVCASVSEAVAHAAGLICDRSLTGWDVRVFAMAGNAEHDLALRILGAARQAAMPEGATDRELLRAVVVSDSLYLDREDVRHWVAAAMSDPLVEVLVCNTGLPTSDVRQVEVPVSRAAAAFRDQALATAGLQATAATSEVYCQLRTGRFRHTARRQSVLTTVNGV